MKSEAGAVQGDLRWQNTGSLGKESREGGWCTRAQICCSSEICTADCRDARGAGRVDQGCRELERRAPTVLGIEPVPPVNVSCARNTCHLT